MRIPKFSFVLVTLTLTLALVISACAAPPPPVASGGEAAPAEGEAAMIQVGLVTDVGRINDRSFNQSAWEGVLTAQEAVGLSADDGQT